MRVIDNPRVGCAARGRRKEGDGSPARPAPAPLHGGHPRPGCSGGRARQRARDRGLSREPQEEEERTPATVCRPSPTAPSPGTLTQRNQVVVAHAGAAGDNTAQVVGSRHPCAGEGGVRGGDSGALAGVTQTWPAVCPPTHRPRPSRCSGYRCCPCSTCSPTATCSGSRVGARASSLCICGRDGPWVGPAAPEGRPPEQARPAYLKKGFFRSRRLLDLEPVWSTWATILMS